MRGICGHYINRIECNDKWYSINDKEVKEVFFEEVTDFPSVLLLYEIVQF